MKPENADEFVTDPMYRKFKDYCECVRYEAAKLNLDPSLVCNGVAWNFNKAVEEVTAENKKWASRTADEYMQEIEALKDGSHPDAKLLIAKAVVDFREKCLDIVLGDCYGLVTDEREAAHNADIVAIAEKIRDLPTEPERGKR